MKKYLLLILIFHFYNNITASSQVIKGKVVDEKNNAVEFANIVLLNLPDSSFIAGTVSNPDGTFSFDKTADIVKISSIGYTTVYCKPKELTQPVILREETNQLNEIVVKARLPKYKQTAEGLQTKVKGTALSSVGSASDVLRNMPLIKEENGNFSVFGKGTPIIYINGRIMRSPSELENIKSDNIKNIEIITNPGARYDASVGSIIKIKTISPEGEGWGFSVYSDYYQADKEDASTQLDINYRIKKWDLFGNIKYNRNNYWTKSKLSQSVFVDTLWNQTNSMFAEGMNQEIQTIAGFNYQIDDSKQFGSRLQTIWYLDTKEKTNIESLVKANNSYFDRWQNEENKTISRTPLYDYNLYYTGKSGKWTIDFNFDFLFSGSNTISDVEENSEVNDDRIVQSENKVTNKLLASRFIATHPLFGGYFSGGIEHSFVNRTDNYINHQNIVPSSFSKLKENYLSSYLEYNRKFKHSVLKAGLRYEFVDFRYFNKGEFVPEQSRRYNQFFPNLAFSTQIGKMDLQLAYTSKVKRPSFNQLSNNVFYGNRYTLQTGNPLLRSSAINSVGMSGLWKFLQFGISYNMEKDAIIYSAEQLKENQAITKVMFKNLDKLNVLTSFITIAPEFGIWSPTINAGIRKQWLTVISNNESVKMNKPVYNLSFNNMFRFPWDIIFSLKISYQSKGDYQNVYLNTSQYILNASISKAFLNKKLTIQLKGYDLLNGYNDGNLLFNKQMQMDILNHYDRRRVGISIKYNFNASRNKYKGNGISMEKKNRL
ncbi:MAG: TonB-dependent receptor family protein [Parabacteroides sp.]|nr:TonB-dependent receptor family protein [Parabacteroides sp.]